MKWYEILLLVLNILLILFVLIKYIIYKIVFNHLIKKNMYDKCFCNDCEKGFIMPWETDFVYCPYCGKELDYYIDFKESDLFEEFLKSLEG